MHTYRFNIPLAFLFCRPLSSTVLVIFPGTNILKKEPEKNVCYNSKTKEDQEQNVLTVSIDVCLYTMFGQ